jgi:uncharacterized protein (TIGR02598 family)
MNGKTLYFMRPRHQAAFTLVEVVLALGVITFGLVVILALIPVSIHSSKQSSEDMALSLMTQSTIADLHKQGLTTLAALVPTSGTISYYFDANGRLLTSSTGALYSCTAKPIAPSAVASANTTSTNFIYVQLQFVWPTTAPAANQQKTVLITSIGNYD